MPRRDADWPTAAAFLPPEDVLSGPGALDALRTAAADCRGCPLWEPATQTVFGRGGTTARLVLVGEQPGDVEDQQGVPFVGPAGRELVSALDEAGVDRSDVYVTNTVKHFKFRAQGKRRIHATPDTLEVHACTPWLGAELAAVQPELVVLLGATAGKALMGASFRVTQDRGQVLATPAGLRAVATIHPSAVLRADDRQAAHDGLVADLRVVAGLLTGTEG